jgi:hypothetical protein
VGEVQKLGITVAKSTIEKYRPRECKLNVTEHHCERVIGSIRRDALDHALPLLNQLCHNPR